MTKLKITLDEHHIRDLARMSDEFTEFFKSIGDDDEDSQVSFSRMIRILLQNADTKAIKAELSRVLLDNDN